MRLHFIRDIKKSGTPCRPFDGTKCYVDTGSVNRTTISSATEVCFSDKPSRANLSASVGDVLFAKMQGTTKVLLINDELSSNIYSTGFYAFRDSRIEPGFLRYFFLSPRFNIEKDRLSKGATMKAINDDGMAQISISAPSLSKQKEITAELDAIEKTIKLSNAQISLLDYQVKSLFNKRRAAA